VNEKIEDMIAGCIKFADSVIQSQSKVCEEALFAIGVYCAKIGEVNNGIIFQDTGEIVKMKSS
jgi:predicted transcriptional regulator